MQILPKCSFSFLLIIHNKYVAKAEPALQGFNMLHMHSKQYLHLLYTTLQALKTWQTTKKQIQFGLIALDASQKVYEHTVNTSIKHYTNNLEGEAAVT